MTQRLIDANALNKHKFLSPQVKVICGRNNGKTKEQIIQAYQKGWNDCIDAIVDNAPTVDIEEEFERPQGGWIPATERLPEDMQKVLIWFEYYRYGDFNCMYQTYGFGHVCDGKWSPFINGETGWQDYNIIAWQPLPEPYEKGGTE